MWIYFQGRTNRWFLDGFSVEGTRVILLKKKKKVCVCSISFLPLITFPLAAFLGFVSFLVFPLLLALHFSWNCYKNLGNHHMFLSLNLARWLCSICHGTTSFLPQIFFSLKLSGSHFLLEWQSLLSDFSLSLSLFFFGY